VRTTAELTADRNAPARARAAVAPFADALGPHGLAHAQLIVTELVTNSLRYAGNVPGEPVALSLELIGGRLRIEVSDAGGASAPQLRQTHPGAASGWGLRLVDELASNWGVERSADTCTVWCELELERSALA
jgi:anti-sigma regulatory factor (Ser/Thr protein kinase)